jgi:hypothetical protein
LNVILHIYAATGYRLRGYGFWSTCNQGVILTAKQAFIPLRMTSYLTNLCLNRRNIHRKADVADLISGRIESFATAVIQDKTGYGS